MAGPVATLIPMPKKLSDERLGSPVPTYTTSLLGSASHRTAIAPTDRASAWPSVRPVSDAVCA